MSSSRREFLINGARLAGGLAIASCAPAAMTPAATGGPIKKDLIIGSAVEIVDGQPYHQTSTHAYGHIHPSMYDYLTGRDVNYKLEPRIATSWSAITPTTWQFKLRPGVRFHNGDPLTAADVKWSIEHTYDPAAKTIYAASFASVSKIDVLDELTVNITTKVPDPFIPEKLSVKPGYVMPSKYFQSVGIEGMNAKPVGSGPYMFKERVSGSHFTLVRNPNYWRGMPDADSITALFRPDLASRVAALKTGEINMMVGVPYDQIDSVNASAAAKVVTVPDNGIGMYIINAKVKPLDNKLVRQALSLSIDRPGLNKTLGRGLYAIANGPVASFEFSYDPARPPLAFDPAKAKSLLQQAGYAGEKIALEYNPQTDPLLDQALAEGWKTVGFNIEMVPMDAATRARKIGNLGFLGLTSATFGSRYGDPDGVIWRTLQPGGSLRYWSSQEFDKLGFEQASSTDPALRLRNWKRMTEIMLDEMVWLSLWIKPVTLGMSKKIDLKATLDQNDDFAPGHLTFKP